ERPVPRPVVVVHPSGPGAVSHRLRHDDDQLRIRRDHQPHPVQQADEAHAHLPARQGPFRTIRTPEGADRSMTLLTAPQNQETEADILARLESSPTLLDVRGLCVDYVTEAGNIRACDDIDLTLKQGEILGVAGESASGK